MIKKAGGTNSVASSGAETLPIEAVVERVREISTLPDVALRVIHAAADPAAGAVELSAIVEADPALCVRVLRSVNSAAFGLRAPVSDLGQAVSYLGFNRIRDLAVTASVSDLFRSKRAVGSYRRSALWKHLVAVAVCARMIAARRKIGDFANAYLAGLLHDIGIILLDQHHHEGFRRVVLSLDASTSLPEAERRVLGWDHTELGHRVGARWKLPPVVLAAIRWHHEPEKESGPDAPLVHCVSVANLICSLRGIPSVGAAIVGLSPGSLEVLALDRTDLKILAEDLDRELALHEHLFEIQGA